MHPFDRESRSRLIIGCGCFDTSCPVLQINHSFLTTDTGALCGFGNLRQLREENCVGRTTYTGKASSTDNVEKCATQAVKTTSPDRAICRSSPTHLKVINLHLSRIREKYSPVGRDASSKSTLLIRALEDDLITIDEL